MTFNTSFGFGANYLGVTPGVIWEMDMYVRVFDDMKRVKGDNPIIGIILCADKEETMVKYFVLNESKQLFASKYMTFLPTEEELSKELERNREFYADR